MSGCALLLSACLLPLFFMRTTGKTSRRIALFIMLSGLACITTTALICFFSGTDCNLLLYALTPELLFNIHLDRLAAFFTALIGLVAFCCVIYSLNYIEHGGSERKTYFNRPAAFYSLDDYVVASRQYVRFPSSGR